LADRYFKSLYEILLVKEIIFSKHIRELLKLTMKSLLFDTNLARTAAFLKRLLQISLIAEPSFITCILIIVSQIMRNKHKLWKMLEKNTQANKSDTKPKVSTLDIDPNLYDFVKRDPIYSSADQFPLFEINILLTHYHPTVKKFAQFILENYNKTIIEYEGDPLLDFSLVNFLEKFMLKNPKFKSEKGKKKNMDENQEEEDLKRFMGEDEEMNGQDDNDAGEKLDFIKRFNEIERVKSTKKIKETLKKMKNKNIDNIDKFADNVMDEEYEKLDKDIDEDVDLGDLADLGENLEEDLDEIGAGFADAENEEYFDIENLEEDEEAELNSEEEENYDDDE